MSDEAEVRIGELGEAARGATIDRDHTAERRRENDTKKTGERAARDADERTPGAPSRSILVGLPGIAIARHPERRRSV